MKFVKDPKYSVMFDRIEAGTYLIAAAITEGNLKIKNIIPKIIKTEINILKKIGAKIKILKVRLKLLEIRISKVPILKQLLTSWDFLLIYKLK